MGRTAPVIDQQHRSLVFLCLECKGDLECTGSWWGACKVWRCVSCAVHWVYRGAGWERVRGQ